jgi:hypothetical protein
MMRNHFIVVDLASVLLICTGLLPPSANANELAVRPVGYWNVELQCELPPGTTKPTTARTTVTQPQRVSREFVSPTKVVDGKVRWNLVYPLVDEGRFDVEPGNWSGYWIMGDYRFQVELLDGEQVVHRAEVAWDPMAQCPRDRYGPIFMKYPQQFIECAPLRPAYIDTDRMQFSIRTIPGRVAECTAIVEVTAAHSDRTLAGPWTLKLTGTAQQQEFDTAGWPRGEYWIRVELQRGGQAVGARMIRKVWKEILPPLEPVAKGPRIGSGLQLCTSPAHFAAVEGVRFVPSALSKQPDGPLVTMDRPWETELLYYQTLHYDDTQKQYVLEYELAGGDAERAGERANLPSTLCRAVSSDGLTWTKPALGLVGFQGTTANNLIPKGEEFVPSNTASTAPLTHEHAKAKFRRYDAQRDGSVNLQNVFVTSVKRSFVSECPDASGEPYRVGAWPMEKRGNEYLVLTPEAILWSGTGMDLLHSTEMIALHVEDRATGTLYYYFRPGAPPYPPHDAPYDNMHMVRRCLGVMWTKDGVNWERRLIAAPDEREPAATQFYYNSLYSDEKDLNAARPAMALEDHWNQAVITDVRSAFGVFTVFDAKGNRLWPELVAIDDLLHWRRFNPRAKFIANGPPGSYDHGLIKIATRLHAFGNEWWFPYQAINGLHQDYIGLAKVNSVEQLKTQYPNYAEMPGFVDWDQYWQRCKSMRYYTGIARAANGRVCHAEAVEKVGTLQTVPFVAEGEALLVNAAAPTKDSLRVEVLDESGTPLPGFEQSACRPIAGDLPEEKIAWSQGQWSDLKGRTIALRFVLQGAQLYGYRLR